MTLTQAHLRHRLHYDPDTGVFTWLNPNKYRPEYKGRGAGSLHTLGYIHIYVDGKAYKAHRLAWFYVHGEWPLQDIDHMNGDRADNRIANLRDVSRSSNAENRHHAREGHALGLLGVVWRKRNKKYEARIHVGGKYLYLGLFHTKEEAHAVYLAAKRKHHAAYREAGV
jgi:hypothetical protein